MPTNDPKPEPSSDRGIEDDVKDLIEKCLQLYMSTAEVIIALSEHFNIEPFLTFLVWRKLEEDNPQFFLDYYIRLKLIKQIIQFNWLLEQQRQYELMVQEGFGKQTLPKSEPSPDIAGGIYRQQLSNATTAQYSDNVLGSMYGDHFASTETAAVASMGSPVQPHCLHSINQRESLTHANSEQSMPSNCCLPFDLQGMGEHGVNPSSFDIHDRGCLSFLNDPASSSSPDHGEFKTEANQLNSLDILIDSPEHRVAGQDPDVPSESYPGSQTPGKNIVMRASSPLNFI